jgi:hypothetical protein
MGAWNALDSKINKMPSFPEGVVDEKCVDGLEKFQSRPRYCG